MTSIGILGAGFMTVAHLKAYAKIPNARIVALCNPSGRHLDGDFTGVAGNVGDSSPFRLDMTDVAAYRDVGQFLAHPGLQIVDVCTPTRTHVPLGLAVLQARKHLLLEKPLARTAAEADQLLAAAARSEVYAMPAMCLRFWPEYVWLLDAIRSQRFGRVLDARFRRVAQAPAWGRGHFLSGSTSGGALFDLHIHDVDIVQACFGRPKSVFASGYSKVSGAIDHVLAMYQVESGATVSAEGSWAMSEGFGFSMSFTVNFENATLDLDPARGAESFRLFVPGRPPEVIQPAGPDGYVGELEYFIRCVETHTRPATVTLEDGRNAVRLCEAEEESIRTGRVVTV